MRGPENRRGPELAAQDRPLQARTDHHGRRVEVRTAARRALARAKTPRGAGVVIATASTTITVAAGLLMTILDHGNFPSIGSDSGGPSRRSRRSGTAIMFPRRRQGSSSRRSSCSSGSASSRSSPPRSRARSCRAHASSRKHLPPTLRRPTSSGRSMAARANRSRIEPFTVRHPGRTRVRGRRRLARGRRPRRPRLPAARRTADRMVDEASDSVENERRETADAEDGYSAVLSGHLLGARSRPSGEGCDVSGLRRGGGAFRVCVLRLRASE